MLNGAATRLIELQLLDVFTWAMIDQHLTHSPFPPSHRTTTVYLTKLVNYFVSLHLLLENER